MNLRPCLIFGETVVAMSHQHLFSVQGRQGTQGTRGHMEVSFLESRGADEVEEQWQVCCAKLCFSMGCLACGRSLFLTKHTQAEQNCHAVVCSHAHIPAPQRDLKSLLKLLPEDAEDRFENRNYFSVSKNLLVLCLAQSFIKPWLSTNTLLLRLLFFDICDISAFKGIQLVHM